MVRVRRRTALWCGQCDEVTRMLGFDGDAPRPCLRCKPWVAAGRPATSDNGPLSLLWRGRGAARDGTAWSASSSTPAAPPPPPRSRSRCGRSAAPRPGCRRPAATPAPCRRRYRRCGAGCWPGSTPSTASGQVFPVVSGMNPAFPASAARARGHSCCNMPRRRRPAARIANSAASRHHDHAAPRRARPLPAATRARHAHGHVDAVHGHAPPPDPVDTVR